ncbi:MAG: cytosolic protein [Rhodopirellula sp.]|nr:cytosolic protein [Rhodopirellula sp.]
MMTDYDSPWKEAQDVYFEQFMAMFFPAAHAEIDWSRGYESLDKELQQIVREGELGRRLVDKLVKVWLNDGLEQWLLVHTEVQTFEEAEFARRMYVYNYRLFDRYNREVVSLVVLGDDSPDWRPDRFGYSRWGFQAGIRFPVVKLLDYASRSDELERSPNLFAIVVLAHLKTLDTRRDPGQRRAWKVRLIKGLYDRGLGADEVRRLFRVIDWMMDLPETLEATYWREIKQYEEERHMPYITTPERIGRAEGLSEGLSQGLSRGLSQGLRKGIEVALKLRFGDQGEPLLNELQSIEDRQTLEEILNAIPVAANPDDLRKIWTN